MSPGNWPQAVPGGWLTARGPVRDTACSLSPQCHPAMRGQGVANVALASGQMWCGGHCQPPAVGTNVHGTLCVCEIPCLDLLPSLPSPAKVTWGDKARCCPWQQGSCGTSTGQQAPAGACTPRGIWGPCRGGGCPVRTGCPGIASLPTLLNPLAARVPLPAHAMPVVGPGAGGCRGHASPVGQPP